MAESLIKKDIADTLLQGKGGFNFTSIEATARNIIEHARAEAEAQLTRARDEIHKMREEIRGQEFELARKEGQEKGHKEGLVRGQEEGRKAAEAQHLSELRAKTQSVAPALQKAASELESRRSRLIEEAEKDLLALAYAIAERITRLRIERDPAVLHKLVASTIELVLSRGNLDVFLAPADTMAIDEYLPELRKAFPDLGAVRLHADETLARGSVVVRTARGEVATRVDEMLDTIAHELLGIGNDGVVKRATVHIGPAN